MAGDEVGAASASPAAADADDAAVFTFATRLVCSFARVASMLALAISLVAMFWPTFGVPVSTQALATGIAMAGTAGWFDHKRRAAVYKPPARPYVAREISPVPMTFACICLLETNYVLQFNTAVGPYGANAFWTTYASTLLMQLVTVAIGAWALRRGDMGDRGLGAHAQLTAASQTPGMHMRDVVVVARAVALPCMFAAAAAAADVWATNRAPIAFAGCFGLFYSEWHDGTAWLWRHATFVVTCALGVLCTVEAFASAQAAGIPVALMLAACVVEFVLGAM